MDLLAPYLEKLKVQENLDQLLTTENGQKVAVVAGTGKFQIFSISY